MHSPAIRAGKRRDPRRRLHSAGPDSHPVVRSRFRQTPVFALAKNFTPFPSLSLSFTLFLAFFLCTFLFLFLFLYLFIFLSLILPLLFSPIFPSPICLTLVNGRLGTTRHSSGQQSVATRSTWWKQWRRLPRTSRASAAARVLPSEGLLSSTRESSKEFLTNWRKSGILNLKRPSWWSWGESLSYFFYQYLILSYFEYDHVQTTRYSL